MAETLTETHGFVVARWRKTLIACVVVLVTLLALFYSTVSGMVYIWYNFETYTHGFIILPITLWLIWQKRVHLAAFTPQPTSRFIGLVLFGLAVWAVARLAGVLVIEQLAFVGVLITSLATLLGWQVSKFLAFPLLFLLFAVPMGEDLVPPMMEFTATFTVGAIKLSGIPVYRDGLWFSLPSGNWSVVEACSGVRYLIASVTLGVMYAYITYHTLWKRLLFILLSAVVPILANGVRAYMIVMIGHLSEMEYATGVDHLIYGWFFFGVVMFLLFWLGSYWQEEQTPPNFVAPPRAISVETVGNRVMTMTVFILLASAFTVWSVTRAADSVATVDAPLRAPDTVGTWSRASEPPAWLAEHLDTPHTFAERYASNGDQVQLFVALFPDQRQGSEAISSGNALAADILRQTGLGTQSVELDGNQISIRQYKVLVRNNGIDHEHLVWQWYRIAGHSLSNRYEGKAWEALSRIYPGRTDGAWIAITTPLTAEDQGAAERRLMSFAGTVVPQVYRAMDSSVGLTD